MIINKDTEIALQEFEQLSKDVLSRGGTGSDFTKAGNFVPPWLHCTKQLFPPFTYLGGKRGIASEVWRRFGWDIPNYIEPFAGGLSVLLARPVFDLRNLKKNTANW